jgi:hypothetical protein
LRGGGRHVRFVIDPSQRIVLEGDFGKDYQVFVPKGHETTALSILSSDVMFTLQQYATAFDVEIYGDQVRVISNKRVSRNKKLQEALLAVALKVTEEVDHRLASWSRSGSLAAQKQDLHMYPGSGFRVPAVRPVCNILVRRPDGLLAFCQRRLSNSCRSGIARSGAAAQLGIFLLSLFGVIFGLTVFVTWRRWHSDSFRSRRGWGDKEHKA